MLFRKRGSEVVAALTKAIALDKEALVKAQEFFEHQREKSALARIEELKLEISRFERIVKHARPDETYDLTEQDLIDFSM